MTETSASCFGAIDGTATVNASGGTPTGTNSYTYVWNSTPQQTTQTATNLVGGQTYTVVVTDSLGCTSTDNITISQPAEIVLTTTQVNVTCDGFFDASATVNVTGGTPAYTYLWDANANNQTTQTATALASGTYEVTVTDFNGCTETASVTIIEPNPLFINTMATAVACKGDASGTASATFSGGTMPYNSVWSFNNTAASQITNVPAGTYFVTLTDANGCQLVDSVIINEPNEDLGTNAEKIDNICYDDRNGKIKLTGTGGTFPYLYSLDGENYSNSNQFVGLDAGDYTVYTKDANGCTFDQIVRITEPAEFTVETVEDREIVFGDPARLDVTPTNGVEPIIYTWTPDETLDCNPCQSPKVDSLLNDTYFEVFAVDANGCEAEDGMFVRVTTPRRVFIATGMTPNDDGNNDILYVQGGTGTLEVTSFQVFDRWGELVFEATNTHLNDTSFGWDGTYKGQDAPGGTYVWAVQVEFTDGRIVTYQGSTSLIR
jgi:gliding motility-associated-like protein